MIGYDTLIKIEDVKTRAAKLGFALTRDHYHTSGIALRPVDDELPIYSRDAMLMHGDLDQIDHFLLGIEWTKKYLIQQLRVTSEEKITRKEQDYRNRRMLSTIEGEKYGT